MIANSPFCKTKFRRDLLNSKPWIGYVLFIRLIILEDLGEALLL